MFRSLPFRRIKWPGWIVLILLGVFMTIGISKLTGSSEGNLKQKDDKVVSNIEFEHTREESEHYTMLINTPVIENPSSEKTIQEWIASQKKAFLTDIETEKEHLGSGYRAHLTIQVDAKKGTNDTTSLIFNSYKIVNSVYGENRVKIYTVDSSHQLLQFTDVVTTYDKTIDAIRSNLKEQLKKNEEIKNDLIDQKVNEVLKSPASWNWMVYENALTLYFEKSKLTKSMTGTLEVKVPLQENEKVLKSEEKYVALTFDDGPSMNVTPRVLDILQQHDAKATFFMLGSQVEKYPSLAERVAKSGHEIGNHTDHHMDLTKVGEPQMVQEVQISNQKIQDATGKSPTLIRPPYGAFNSKVEEVARKNGSSLVLWSVDSLDWKSKNAEAIHQVVKKEVVSGSIILLHDVHPTTAEALPKLLNMLEKEGYHFLTVSQLLSLQGKNSAGTYHGKT